MEHLTKGPFKDFGGEAVTKDPCMRESEEWVEGRKIERMVITISIPRHRP